MPHKVVTLHTVRPGLADEELRRATEALAHLRTRPGFVSYEAMQTGENVVLVIQTWETRDHFIRAAQAEEVRRGEEEPLEEIVVAREVHAGDVVLSSG